MDLKVSFLVIGSGIAGLMYAIEVAKYGSVVIITKKKAIDTSTNLAQGGIASALGVYDSFELHAQDTINSGAGLCNRAVVNRVVSSGSYQINKLIKMGIRFSKKYKSSELDLGMEGGHSQNRIVHAKDMTGQEIESVLLEKIQENKNILLLEEHIAIDFITSPNNQYCKSKNKKNKLECLGAYVFDKKEKKVKSFISKTTLIASGGSGKVYIYTTNPDIATGDGIAMGYRAGSAVANLEFVQFHPTCLYNPLAKNFLISEAVRGEGGRLVGSNGIPFMHKYDPIFKDLACRDVVARAIDTELKKTGENFVLLDISYKQSRFIKNRFPNLYEKCLHFGIDMTKEAIPVVPAAHYMCGGIATDINARTNIKNLYAIGEVACTGLHGANRLASNSLLEALVYADSAAKTAIKEIEKSTKKNKLEIPKWHYFSKIDNDELIMISNNWDEIRRLMWNYVGIVRSDKRLARAYRRILNIQNEIKTYYNNFNITSDLIELKNIALVSELIIKSASIRKESRGLHYNIGYPKKNNKKWQLDTVLQKKI